MKSSDHKLLAEFLIDVVKSEHLLEHQKAFVIGCMLPDYIPFTFMRGYLKTKTLKGHNTENIKGYIEKRLKRLKKKNLRSTVDFLKLGLLVHYVADSFTYPHNKEFKGTILEHVIYELELHKLFEMEIENFQRNENEGIKFEISEYFSRQHYLYERSNHGLWNDSYYIVSVSLNIFKDILKEEAIYENMSFGTG